MTAILDSRVVRTHPTPLLTVVPATRISPDRVHLTDRELEVLTTYIMGATMDSTARAHFIAESTVRSHYRRVTDRYGAAGRPVGNKAELLLELIEDGWIDPAELITRRRRRALHPTTS